MALKYSDISNGIIHVTQSLAQPGDITEDRIDGSPIRRQHVLWEPKCYSSIRNVPIPSELMKEITSHRLRQRTELLAQGINEEPEFLFTSIDGNFLDGRDFSRSFERLLKRAGVPHKKFHAFRHTYATRLLLAGTPLSVVQKLMGHSSIEMTAVYLHADIDDKTAAVEKLNALFI